MKRTCFNLTPGKNYGKSFIMVQVRRRARSRAACSERALGYRLGSEVPPDRSGYRAFFERRRTAVPHEGMVHGGCQAGNRNRPADRKSTRLNSTHTYISSSFFF